MIAQVTASLYVGDAAALQLVAERGFTHVVSIVNYAVKVPAKCEHHTVDIEDSSDANIIDSLEEALEVIEEAIDDGGKVLVHCHHGTSRSAAVVLAFMCYSMGLSLDDALEVLLLNCPGAMPNDGFLQQLRLFVNMGCEIDPDHEGYKRFKLQRRNLQWQAEGLEAAAEERAAAPTELDPALLCNLTVYRCRQCRSLLSSSRNVVDVQQGRGQDAFPFKKRDKAAADSQKSGSGALFVEPIQWMEGLFQIAGKLYCPKCQAKVGHWNWAGMQDPSGSWVTPAFCLHVSKLDAVPPQQALDANVSVHQAEAKHACRTAWFTHIVFDCDGVLVDTERASCEALQRAIFQVTGALVPSHFPEDFYPLFGMSVRSCVEYYNRKVGDSQWIVEEVAPAVQAAKEKLYQQLTAQGIEAFGGGRAMILEARSLGMGVAVASSETAMVSASHVAQGKPAPDVFLEALTRVQCDVASKALVIEDTVHGLQAARAAGVYTVAITNTLPASVLRQHADRVITHLTDLDLASMTGNSPC